MMVDPGRCKGARRGVLAWVVRKSAKWAKASLHCRRGRGQEATGGCAQGCGRERETLPAWRAHPSGACVRRRSRPPTSRASQAGPAGDKGAAWQGMDSGGARRDPSNLIAPAQLLALLVLAARCFARCCWGLCCISLAMRIRNFHRRLATSSAGGGLMGDGRLRAQSRAPGAQGRGALKGACIEKGKMGLFTHALALLPAGRSSLRCPKRKAKSPCKGGQRQPERFCWISRARCSGAPSFWWRQMIWPWAKRREQREGEKGKGVDDGDQGFPRRWAQD